MNALTRKKLIVIRKINVVKNFNAGKKLHKPGELTVNTNIPKSNVSRR